MGSDQLVTIWHFIEIEIMCYLYCNPQMKGWHYGVRHVLGNGSKVEVIEMGRVGLHFSKTL